MEFKTLVPLVTFIGLVSMVGNTNSIGAAGNIKLVLMKTNQYWFSTSSPYAPVLNFYLAYQYCRNLGLQLATLETKDEIDAVALYLTTSAEGSAQGVKDYWTSGNRLGAETWLWMSNGEQMNSSFIVENGLQQRQYSQTASPRHCLSLRSLSTRRTVFTPEVCERSLPFICEQIRCLSYYYPTVEFPEPGSQSNNGLEFQNGLRSDAEAIETSNATTVPITVAPSSSVGTTPGKMRRYLNSEPVKNAYFLPSSSLYANRNTQSTTSYPIRRFITLRPPKPTLHANSSTTNVVSESEASTTTPESIVLEETAATDTDDTVGTLGYVETTQPSTSTTVKRKLSLVTPFKNNGSFIEVHVGTS